MSVHQTLLCRYHYDPLDRLAGHVTAGEADIRLFYQKSRLAMQAQGALHRSILQVDDQLLAQQHSAGKAVEATLLATDQQRCVLQSIGGGQREASAYTAYGHLPMSSGLSSLLSFDGERRDPVTGHYLLGNGYRAFNPVLMRFNSPDSLSPFGDGGLNAYAYCQGDPVNYRDPTGHIIGPYYGLMKIVDPFTDSVKWLRGAKVFPKRSTVPVRVSDTLSDTTAVLPRPVESINAGEGLRFDFYSEEFRRTLSGDEYLDFMNQNHAAFNAFDARGAVEIDRVLDQLGRINDYNHQVLMDMPPAIVPQELRQELASNFIHYRERVNQMINALIRR
ncbi:hypothetical protein PS3A_34460 [Pseudomonas sp. 3A(2025)]